MPWTMRDYPASMKNLPQTTKKKAIDIANAMLEEGYKENKAIPIAIEQAKKWYQETAKEDREDYLEKGDVQSHDEKRTSNPALLEEDEMVFWKDDQWAVQSKKAKKASKLFDKKTEAVQYGKKVAENKETKLIVYLKDGSIEDTYTYD